jgi:hypothetical protein
MVQLLVKHTLTVWLVNVSVVKLDKQLWKEWRSRMNSTGGIVVVLGKTGRNFAGMSGNCFAYLIKKI